MSDLKSKATSSNSSSKSTTTTTSKPIKQEQYYNNDIDLNDDNDEDNDDDDDDEEEDGGSSDVDFILNDDTNNIMNNNNGNNANSSLNILNQRMNDVDEEFKYEVLTPDKIVQHMIECIKEVNQVVELPATTTRILLHHFRWDKEKLMERYLIIIINLDFASNFHLF